MSHNDKSPKLETGSYQPDKLETGSNKPEKLETGSYKPEQTETDSVKSETRSNLRQLLLQSRYYPKDFKSRMMFTTPVPLVDKRSNFVYDVREDHDIVSSKMFVSFSQGSKQQSISFFQDIFTMENPVIYRSYLSDTLVGAPQLQRLDPHVTPTPLSLQPQVVYHHSTKIYFLPSQQFIFSSPFILPEHSIGDTLLSSSSRAMFSWPAMWKRIPSCLRVSGDVTTRFVPGVFNYLFLQFVNGDNLIIQATDFEVYVLSCRNPEFAAAACVLNGRSQFIAVNHVCTSTVIIDFLRLREPKLVWAMLNFGHKIINAANYAYCRSYDYIENLLFTIRSNPKILMWKKRNLLKMCKYCVDEGFQVTLLEDSLPKHFPETYGELFEKVKNSLKCNTIQLQGCDITLQGFSDLFGLLSPPSEKNISLLTSFRELGKLSGNVNGVFEFMNKPPMDFLVNLIAESSTVIVGIFKDFVEFLKNPVYFVRAFVEQTSQMERVDREPTLYEGALVLGGLILSYVLYENNPTLATSVFFVSAYSVANSFSTVKTISRKIAVLATMIFLSVMRALQSLSAPISLQGPSSLTGLLVTACGGIACLIAGVNTYGTSHGIFEYLGKNTKDILLLSRGTLSLVACLEFVLDTIRKGIEYLVGDTALYKTLVKCTISNQDLKDYIVYALTKTPEILSTTLTMDEMARREWEKMCSLHNHFLTVFAAGKSPTESHIGYSMYSKAYQKFTILKEEYIKIKDSLDYFRPEPFMVWLWGSPGTGKTWCRDQLVNNMYRWHQKIDQTIPDAKTTGLIYVRNPADKYMSSYVGQFAVAYDDVGQNRQSDNPEFNELMAVGSTNQVRLNMADLAEKGRLFSSKVVIMAANTQDVCANNLIMKEEAFNRRRHIVVEIDRPQTTQDVVSTSDRDFSKVALRLTDPRTGSFIVRFPTSGYENSKDVWMNFYKWLAPRYVRHVKTQKDLLELKMQQLQATTTGATSDLIYDYEEEKLDLPSEDFEATYEPDPSVRIEGEGDIALSDNTESPVYTDTKKLKFVRTYEDPTDRFRIACCLFPELGEAADTYKQNKNDLTRANLETVYKRIVKEDLPTSVFVPPDASPPPIDVVHLDSAWEYYTAARDGFNLPYLKYLTWAGVAVGAFGMFKVVKMLTSGDDPSLSLQSYSHDPRAPPTSTVIVNRYDSMPQAPAKNNVIVQSVTEDLIKLYRKSLFRVECIVSGTTIPRYRSINFVQIAYDLFLAPKHFFNNLDRKCFRISNEHTTYSEIEISNSNITPLDDLDFYIVRIPEINYGKNILNHFPTRDEIKSIIAFNSMVISWNKQQGHAVLNYTGEAKRWDIPISVACDGSEICFPSGYKYGWESSPGDCGSLLIARDNACCSKLMGLHFGYDSSLKKGLSVILTRERLQPYIDKLAPIKVEVKDPVIEVQSSEIPIDLTKDDRPLFDYLGIVKGAPSQPREHKNLFRSPTYGKIYTPAKDLSVLSFNDQRMDPEHRGPPDILTRGVRDFSYPTRSWPSYAMSFGKDCLRYEFSQYTERIPKEVCSIEWAINGTWCGDARVEYTEPLRLDTSAGFGLSGKKLRHFDTTDPKNITIKNPVLQEQVDNQWDAWIGGSTYPCIWTHATKSEPLKLSKIRTGNTRTFCVAQTAFLINVKRLFGSWITAMKSSKIRTFSCLGIDPESGDWTDLYNALRQNSSLGIDMDFFKFDRTAVTWQLASAVVTEINHWYGDSDDIKRARYIAMDDMIHSYCLIGPHLTRKSRGNPSGNPITTELNNCVNFMMLAMVYCITAKKFSPSDLSPVSFRRKIVARTYGDDIIFSVSLRDVDWFTPERIEHVYSFYGVPVTPADKSDSGLRYTSIEELTFLKRSFRPFDNGMFPWQAALSQDSIRSMIDFYRLSPNNGTVEEAVNVNMLQSLEFAYHWGESFFNEHLQKLEDWLRDQGWPALAVSFELFDQRYRMKLGIE